MSSRFVRAPRRSVILGAAAIGILAAGACSEQAAAVRVNDKTVSQSEFMDEVADLYEWVNQEPAEGTYDQEFIGRVATERAMFLLLEEVYEDTGRDLAAEDAELACGQAMQVPPDQIAPGMCETMMIQLGLNDEGIPGWYRDRFVDQAIMSSALNQVYSPAELEEIMAAADIEVSSRFGTWDYDELQNNGGTSGVLAPSGPLVQRDDEAEADPGELDMGEIDMGDLPEDAVIEEAPAGP